MIYLDNSATTKPYNEALDAFRTASEKFFANPSSLHRKGGEAERLLRQARSSIAELLHVKINEVIFTSGGTESNNLAIKGTAFQYLNQGKHLITSCIEHASTLEAFRQLELLGFSVTYLPVDQDGKVSLDELKKALTPDTILVSIMHVNNELGSIQPIKEIGHLIKQKSRALFHIDDVQGIGKVPLDFNDVQADLISYSAHKFHGLKGNGLLIKREKITLLPLLSGGGQEREIRSGTENGPGIVAMAKALRLYLNRAKTQKRMLETIRTHVFAELSIIEGIELNSSMSGAPHIVNFSVPGIKPEVLIHALEEKEIYVSTRSACSSKTAEISHVLAAVGLTTIRARSAIRISLSFETTKEQIDIFLNELQTEVPKLKQVMR
ncbi:aminotransferase class V-fold PLP-dependent enzyme [Bacillus hwajinpoensis]|uniref:Aminotransferase class V-fold PLP-dependent enzyme n=1 Tax=Guptibacillus hwajinpoensis TaxID=208199 RepID=A0A845EW33_9BACL|nr:cysteine desulfurase family protein [Pseudalkalibacillus hwajinpoensis]MYL62752.1 aminotransferase class V-fold PLP-dependent enzyme [Pseudalkalibacillus hwajinpoensis]